MSLIGYIIYCSKFKGSIFQINEKVLFFEHFYHNSP